MPKTVAKPKTGANGGKREGAGRPEGSLNRRHQITAKQIGYDTYLPIEYMLALMRDEQAEPQRRDAMAIQAAPFCHARVAAVATSNPNGKASSADINIVQIFSVPRGAAVDLKGGSVTVEGKAIEHLPSIEPYEGTPRMKADAVRSDPADAAEPVKGRPYAEPLPVLDIDADNITRLDTYRDRDADA